MKYLKKLHQKKYRDAEGLFLLEGEKMVNEALNSDFNLKEICAVRSWIEENSGLLSGIEVREGEVTELAQIGHTAAPNRVIAVLEKRVPELKPELVSKQWSIALESVRDPGNLGTILRIADWFGIDDILLSEDCVDLYNPKVVQSSMGAILRVRAHYVCLFDILNSEPFEEVDKYAAMMNGDSMEGMSGSEKGILLFGNESKGLSEELISACTKRMTIRGGGAAESLNVAMAAAIATHWFMTGPSRKQ